MSGRSRLRTQLAVGAALALTATLGVGGAHADPGADDPTSYFPSDASLTDVPTYQTDRAATSDTGVRNGQDYDHYCKADWQAITTLAGNDSGQTTGVTSMVSKSSTAEHLRGNNGLLYMNQWWNGAQTDPFFRVVWATDYPTTNSRLVLQVGDNWVGGRGSGAGFTPYSEDPATLVTQLDIWAGASKFRQWDWATYVTGLQNSEPYKSTTKFIPGPYTGVNDRLFSLNPDVVTTTQAGFDDPYYPTANQYLPNLDPNDPLSFVNNIEYDPVAKTLTIDLGDQPAGAMIVFGVSGQSVNGSSGATDEAYELTATFTGDYVSTDPTNTVCYPVGVTWSKTDADTGDLLPDSGWALTPTGDAGNLTEPLSVADASGTPGVDADPARGQLGVNSDSSARRLQPGTWELTETQAPDGYTASGDTSALRLDFDNQQVDLGAITNTRADVPTPTPTTTVTPTTPPPTSGPTSGPTSTTTPTSTPTAETVPPSSAPSSRPAPPRRMPATGW